MKKMWSLTDNGYIGQYMIAGPVSEDYSSQECSADQLTLEGVLRGKIASDISERHELSRDMIRLGQKADNGAAYKVYAPCKADMIDVSAFYSTMKKVSFRAAAVLVAPEAMSVSVRLRTYMAVGMYLNGALVGQVKRAVYKPIEFMDITLDLNAGENLIYLVCDNLGARDSRNIVGIQVTDDRRNELKVCLPDDEHNDEVYEAWKFLNSLDVKKAVAEEDVPAGVVVAGMDIPDGAYYIDAKYFDDYEEAQRFVPQKHPVKNVNLVTSAGIRFVVENDIFSLSRMIEITDLIQPVYGAGGFREIADKQSNNRGDFGFSMPNILARYEVGTASLKPGSHDRELLLNTLGLIEERVDCADFEICGLMRLLHLHGEEFDETLMNRVKEVLLDFRYWMDMEGSDAMCFWSENHSLMFYMCAMDAGAMLEEEYFTRAKMTGKELHEYGKRLVNEWLTDVEEYGFEEFLSAVYVNVTLAVLLNVVDFGVDDMSKRATAILDKMFRDMGRHCFRGCMIAPMGRVYRGNIYPFNQGTQEVISMINPDAPTAYGEGWIAFMHGTKYKFPTDLLTLMEEDQDIRYATGNANVVLKKTKDYCLTSVESPLISDVDCENRGASECDSTSGRRWVNIRQRALDSGNDKVDTGSHEYTKSLNESFHGTSCFQPGNYGYQQHMWYAALSPEAVIFANHPGTSSEESDMRPGFWFGNGVMPALLQKENVLGAIYRIPDEHPVKFTHLYCPRNRFDDIIERDNWLFLRKDSGYLGVWMSEKPVPCSDMIFDSELRIASVDAAYVVICGGACEGEQDFESFIRRAESFEPSYDAESGEIRSAGKLFMRYQKGDDRTQVVQ